MKSARTSWLFLLAILALAFALRWRGICHQLPQWTYLDGFVELVQTQYLRDPQSVKWPDMNLGYYPYLTSATAAVLPDMAAARGEGGVAEAVLEASREPWVRVRLAAILLSLGAVIGAWGVARRFVSSSFALLAAAIVATSLVHVTFSSEQRPHGPASGMVALALWATLVFREQGTARSLSIAMLALCLAVAALQSSFALLVPLAIAWWCRDISETGRKTLVPAAIAGLALLALTVRLAYPFHFDERSGSAGEYDTGAETVWMGGHALYTERFHGRGFGVLAKTFAGFDPLLLALAVGAALLWLIARLRGRLEPSRERTAALWICLGYLLPFVLVFGIYDMTYDRFVLPLVPLLAVAVAWGCERVWNVLPAAVRHPLGGVALAACVLGFPLWAAWRLGTLREREDTFEAAARWIEANADASNDRILLLQNFDLPLLYEPASLAALNDSYTLYWTAFQRKLPPFEPGTTSYKVARPPRNEEEEQADAEFLTPKRLRELGFRYVVSMPPRRGGVHDAEAVDLLKSLRKGMERVATFAPAGEEERRARTLDFGFGVTESSTLWNLLSIEAFGPRIEIFRL
jgi:hypothetical protein